MGLVLGRLIVPTEYDNYRVVAAVLLSLAVVVQRHPYNIVPLDIFLGILALIKRSMDYSRSTSPSPVFAVVGLN
jgi:hypothetical protein